MVGDFSYPVFDYLPLITEITIPSTLTYIENACFYNMDNLTSIIIQDGLTNMAFIDCFIGTGVTDMVVPSSVINVGSFTFADMNKLKTVTF